MNEIHEASVSSWRQLDYEWRSTRERWNDGTTRYFEAHFWSLLESEFDSYRHELEALSDTLRKVQDAAYQ